MLLSRKNILALTGLFMCLFLVVHLSANLILLFPIETAKELYNSYSTLLRESLIIKIVAYFLYASILLHLFFSIAVTVRNRTANPKKYQARSKNDTSSWISQNMGLLGVFILLFLFIHLANFWMRIKLGIGQSVEIDEFGNKDIYSVTYALFHEPLYVLFYSVLSIPLGFHLFHGFKSAFKTLGFYHKRGLIFIEKIAMVYAVIMTIGFGVIPLIVYFK